MRVEASGGPVWGLPVPLLGTPNEGHMKRKGGRKRMGGKGTTVVTPFTPSFNKSGRKGARRKKSR